MVVCHVFFTVWVEFAFVSGYKRLERASAPCWGVVENHNPYPYQNLKAC